MITALARWWKLICLRERLFFAQANLDAWQFNYEEMRIQWFAYKKMADLADMQRLKIYRDECAAEVEEIERAIAAIKKSPALAGD